MSGVSCHRYRSPAEWSHLLQSSTSGERCVCLACALQCAVYVPNESCLNSLVESRIPKLVTCGCFNDCVPVNEATRERSNGLLARTEQPCLD